jgi:hypothetical protein
MSDVSRAKIVPDGWKLIVPGAKMMSEYKKQTVHRGVKTNSFKCVQFLDRYRTVKFRPMPNFPKKALNRESEAKSSFFCVKLTLGFFKFNDRFTRSLLRELASNVICIPRRTSWSKTNLLYSNTLHWRLNWLPSFKAVPVKPNLTSDIPCHSRPSKMHFLNSMPFQDIMLRPIVSISWPCRSWSPNYSVLVFSYSIGQEELVSCSSDYSTRWLAIK